MTIDEKLVELTLKRFPDAEAIYFYGSYAAGQNRQDSDIDLGVLLPVPESKNLDFMRL